MNITFYVRADRRDYEHGSSQLNRSFTTIEGARALRDKIAAHIAYDKADYQFPQQGADESEESHTQRVRGHEAMKDDHREEQLDWFDSGHGYFTSAPVIVQRTWEETVIP